MRFWLLTGILFIGNAEASSLEQFKAFYSGTQSARAAFEQTVQDKSGRVVQEAKGSFVFQRPGRFRWVYDKPADQVIVGDGERVWIYDRQLNQVTVRKVRAALGATPAGLLAGGGDVEKAFELAERVRIGFDKGGLRAMELFDHFGQTTRLRFSGLVRNPKVEAGDFRFEPPKGADVLGDK